MSWTFYNSSGEALVNFGPVALTDLDIDGGTDIGAAIVDADLFIVDDGAGGTNRKTTASRIKTYIGETVDVWVGWSYSGGTPAIVDSFNVDNLGDDGVGHIQINIGTDFANAGYAVTVAAYAGTTHTTTASNVGTGSYDIYMWNASNSATDAYGSSLAVGDQ